MRKRDFLHHFLKKMDIKELQVFLLKQVIFYQIYFLYISITTNLNLFNNFHLLSKFLLVFFPDKQSAEVFFYHLNFPKFVFNNFHPNFNNTT